LAHWLHRGCFACLCVVLLPNTRFGRRNGSTSRWFDSDFMTLLIELCAGGQFCDVRALFAMGTANERYGVQFRCCALIYFVVIAKFIVSFSSFCRSCLCNWRRIPTSFLGLTSANTALPNHHRTVSTFCLVIAFSNGLFCSVCLLNCHFTQRFGS